MPTQTANKQTNRLVTVKVANKKQENHLKGVPHIECCLFFILFVICCLYNNLVEVCGGMV